MSKAQRYCNVIARAKSITLGGTKVLFPIDENHSWDMATVIREAIKEAETDAYNRGYAQAQSDIRKALGYIP